MAKIKRTPEIIRQAKEEKARRILKRSFKAFFKKNPPANPYIWGRPTHVFVNELQEAYDRYKQGKSTYLMINSPPRHGKSDVCSRRFPTWFLMNEPEKNVMLATYGQGLSSKMSRDARKCTAAVGGDFGLYIDPEHGGVESWGLAGGHKGQLNAVGLRGGATGEGADLLIIDDFLKNRAEAESPVIRDAGWDGLNDDFFTRLAPVHIVIILATLWHEDDIGGRIKRKMKENPDFPQFKVVRMPAQDEVTGEFLFPERFSDAYYLGHKAGGSYKWDSLYQNNPTARRGNLFDVDKIKIVDRLPDNLRYRRGWDLASTKKQRIKDDPDYTVGAKTSFDPDNRIVYVKDIVRCQAEAPERDRLIKATAMQDGPGVHVIIEQVAGYKDTVTRMTEELKGFAMVESYKPQGDKITRCDPLEPIIDAGNFIIERAPWNESFLAWMRGFPSAAHDDDPDSIVISLGEALHGNSGGVVVSENNFGF